jgi:hypothetical protein
VQCVDFQLVQSLSAGLASKAQPSGLARGTMSGVHVISDDESAERPRRPLKRVRGKQSQEQVHVPRVIPLRGCILTWLIPIASLLAATVAVQDLDGIEFFSGCEAVTRGMTGQGLVCMPFDKVIDPMLNLNSNAGFAHAVELILRLRPGSLIWGAPPCSSFVFMSRGTTLRSKDNPLGNVLHRSVRHANMVVARLVVLLMLGLLRGCQFCVEQPGTSLMGSLPCWQFLMQHFVVHTVRTSMGAFGAPTPKNTILWCSGVWVYKLIRRHTQSRSNALGLPPTTIRYQTKSGKCRVQGGPGLKQTQAYPTEFGEEVARHFAEHKALQGPLPAGGLTDPTAGLPAWPEAKLDRVERFLLGL